MKATLLIIVYDHFVVEINFLYSPLFFNWWGRVDFSLSPRDFSYFLEIGDPPPPPHPLPPACSPARKNPMGSNKMFVFHFHEAVMRFMERWKIVPNSFGNQGIHRYTECNPTLLGKRGCAESRIIPQGGAYFQGDWAGRRVAFTSWLLSPCPNSKF